MIETVMAQHAERLLRSGVAQDALVARQGRAAPPLAIVAPGGAPAGWFVGIVVADQLAGFLQFTSAGELLRYSSFQRRPGGLAGCPMAAEWLDPTTIKQYAQAQAQTGETLGEPVLTYDQAPTRLVWVVPTITPGGQAGAIYVAGSYVYR